MFRHIQALMGIFRNTSGIFITLCNPSSKLWNQGIFRTRDISKLWQTSIMECFAKIVKGCNYFRDISFSRFLLYEINTINFLNACLIFIPEVFILCKKVWGPRGLRAVDFDMPFTITAFHWSKRTTIWKSWHRHK